MMKRLILATILSAALFFSSQSYCQDGVAKTVDGRVVSVDPQGQTIVVKSSEVFTFSVAPDASITNQDGLNMELSDINPDNYVMVGYYTDKSGARVAKSINVEYNN